VPLSKQPPRDRTRAHRQGNWSHRKGCAVSRDTLSQRVLAPAFYVCAFIYFLRRERTRSVIGVGGGSHRCVACCRSPVTRILKPSSEAPPNIRRVAASMRASANHAHPGRPSFAQRRLGKL